MTICATKKRKASEKRKEIGLVALPEEAWLTVSVDGRPLSRLSCSPFGQRELVLGFLFSQDIIQAAGEVSGLRIRADQALVSLRPVAAARLGKYRAMPVIACSGGDVQPGLLDELPTVSRTYDLPLAHAVSLMQRLPSRAKMFTKHGGIHCSMLADMRELRILVHREDIGRSNSVDKVVGWGLSRGIDFSGTALLTTGRVSAEMALKCLHAGIPALISQTTLTSKALEIVRRSGLALIGHVLKLRPILLNY